MRTNSAGVRRIGKGWIAWIALLLPLHALAEDSTLTWNAATHVRYDDNIGFAPDEESKRDEVTTRVQGTVTWQPVQTARSEIALTTGLYSEFLADLTDLNNTGAVGKVRLYQQLTPALTSPWMALESEITWMSFNDSDVREGYKVDSELAFGKRFNEKFGLSVGYRYQLRVSTESDPEGTLVDPIFGDRNSDEVFDQDRQGGFVNVELTFPKTTLFAEYT